MSEETNITQTMDEEYNPATEKQRKWAEFIETTVVDFFSNNKLEKLSLEDGSGNKAKLGRTKDNDIKLEYSTTRLL